MAIENTQPTNINFLSSLGFRFDVNRLPNVTYFCQAMPIPNVDLGEVVYPNPFSDIKVPGTNIEYNTFTLNFIVDEDMKNYKEIYDWIIQLGYPDSFNQYPTNKDNVFSDGTASILSNGHIPRNLIKFEDIFPKGLSGFRFNTNESDLVYIEAQATFAYRKWSRLN